MTKSLCIFTSLLGNKLMAERMLATLGRIEGLEITSVVVGNEDYARYPAPAWTRLTDPWAGQYIARCKTGPVLQQPFDILLMNSWEFVVEFQDLTRRIPSAVVMDSVPATVNAQLRARGVGGWKRWLSHSVHHRAFRKAASNCDFFLPMGSDCADALHHDYGIRRDACLVTLAPQDTSVWSPPTRVCRHPLRLLFVGNDFVRKGGDFLLRLYTDHLAGRYQLTIASNDPELAKRPLPAGVQWLQGRTREQLRQVYGESDLFVFPTRQDYMPQVLAEALTMGVPCLANDVGGIRDLVRDGETGFLMRVEDPPAAWAERLDRLTNDFDALSRMSTAARRFAEQRLNIRRFETMIENVVHKLRSAAQEAGSR